MDAPIIPNVEAKLLPARAATPFIPTAASPPVAATNANPTTIIPIAIPFLPAPQTIGTI